MILMWVMPVFLATCFHVDQVCSCESGSVRLTDGFDNSSGRVEFCYEGTWGAVCEDEWDEKDARVVCRQLGLPSKVVNALLGYGGRVGEVVMDSVRCNGSEQTLGGCRHFGINHGDFNCDEGNHKEDHHKNAGVVCHFNENEECDLIYSPPLEYPAQCGEALSEPSRTCVHRYGSCIPFYPLMNSSICDDLYEAGVDYVYVPHNRSKGSFSTLIEDTVTYGPNLLSSFNKCYEPARRLLCHFYFTPCGNSTVFKAPTTVCPEQCKLIGQLCPEEWKSLVKKYSTIVDLFSRDGLSLIDCDHPGKHLVPLPHCCSDAGITISMNATGTDASQERALIAVGSGIAVVAIVTLLIAVPVLCVFLKRSQKSKETQCKRSIKGIEAVKEAAPIVVVTHNENTSKAPTLQPHQSGHKINRVMSAFVRQMAEENLLVPEESMDLIGKVGQGEFGVVYRATLTNWKEYGQDIVAVKTLKRMFNTAELKNMVLESQIMAKFNHPNVMKLLGVAINKHNTLFVIMPYMAQGSLLSFLRRYRADLTVENEDMTDLIKEISSKLLSISLQIAKGMSYLASQKFVHRDLAARNCMIDENHVIKVADFGLSEDIYARNYFRQAGKVEEGESPVKLPVRWMALESLNDGIFTEKSDVWSFGVTCWEVFSLGKNPYPGVDPFTLVRYLERGERLDRPLNVACSQEIFDIMGSCWNALPEKRPTFSELVTVISSHLEEMAGYLDLTVLPLTTESNMEDHSLENCIS